jgi:hypothetical protein
VCNSHDLSRFGIYERHITGSSPSVIICGISCPEGKHRGACLRNNAQNASCYPAITSAGLLFVVRMQLTYVQLGKQCQSNPHHMEVIQTTPARGPEIVPARVATVGHSCYILHSRDTGDHDFLAA